MLVIVGFQVMLIGFVANLFSSNRKIMGIIHFRLLKTNFKKRAASACLEYAEIAIFLNAPWNRFWYLSLPISHIFLPHHTIDLGRKIAQLNSRQTEEQHGFYLIKVIPVNYSKLDPLTLA